MDDLYLGLDIGGSNVRAALGNSKISINGNVLKKPFSKKEIVEKEVEVNICLLIEEVLGSSGVGNRFPKAIGISLAAIFNRKNGVIEHWPNNNLWNGFPIKEYLQKKYNVPVILEDDANCAAICELYHGSAFGFNSFAYLTVSTGVGCGIILDKKIYSGTNGWAGEIGHTKVQNCNNMCKCGATGCLQTVVAGPALLDRAKKLLTDYNSINAYEIHELKDVVCYANEGEKWAIQVFEEAGQYLAMCLTNLIMILDIPLIVIGGGVSEAGNVFLTPIIKYLNSNLNKRKREVMVKTSKCGDDCGVIGALVLARNVNNIKNSREI